MDTFRCTVWFGMVVGFDLGKLGALCHPYWYRWHGLLSKLTFLDRLLFKALEKPGSLGFGIGERNTLLSSAPPYTKKISHTHHAGVGISQTARQQ